MHLSGSRTKRASAFPDPSGSHRPSRACSSKYRKERGVMPRPPCTCPCTESSVRGSLDQSANCSSTPPPQAAPKETSLPPRSRGDSGWIARRPPGRQTVAEAVVRAKASPPMQMQARSTTRHKCQALSWNACPMATIRQDHPAVDPWAAHTAGKRKGLNSECTPRRLVPDPRSRGRRRRWRG